MGDVDPPRWDAEVFADADPELQVAAVVPEVSSCPAEEWNLVEVVEEQHFDHLLLKVDDVAHFLDKYNFGASHPHHRREPFQGVCLDDKKADPQTLAAPPTAVALL